MAHTRLLLALPLLILATSHAQHIPGYNYDESKIPPYTPLDPLRLANGHEVTTPQQWSAERRPQILHLFEDNLFGLTPAAARHALTHARVIEHNEHALNGLAVREQVELTFDPAPGITPAPGVLHTLRLLVYIPAAAAAAHHPVPVVLGLNFGGNQTVLDDPAIQPTPLWTQPKGAPLQHIAPPEDSRGRATQQWQVRMLLSRGYGLATAYYGDLEPDFKNAAQYSARNLFGPTNPDANAPNAWGAIGLWAWGLSRALDYLQLDPYVDPHHVAVFGHSRLGKAADWAAAQDTRFAAVLSNESGHGGQSIQRRALGETVAHLEHSFPYWFCPNYAKWVGHDAEIPADGNLLLSLIAPRPLYVGSAAGDEWSDPHGELLSALSASRVYHLLGKPALPPDTPQPELDHPIGLNTFVAYHDRSGKHDVTAFDWQHYLHFLDLRWGKPDLTPPSALSSRPKASQSEAAAQIPAVSPAAQSLSSRPEARSAAAERPVVSPATQSLSSRPEARGAAAERPAVSPATTAQINLWRKQIKQALFIPNPLPKLQTQTLSSTEITPGVTLDKVLYTTAYGLRVPAAIYRPTHAPCQPNAGTASAQKPGLSSRPERSGVERPPNSAHICAATKLPGIVVINGHGADKSSWYSFYTGVLYARAGAAVLTYDPIGEGERNDDHKDFTGQHDQLIVNPASMPQRMGGLMVTDVLQAVSYLASRPDVDPHRIAILGFSMGSFIASLAGAVDFRIHSVLLVGGGDLDGPNGYWDLSHVMMCQGGPYRSLAFLGDRPAVLFTLHARRGDTFILNGTADTVVDIPHHGPDFFANLRDRVLTLNGGGKGVFTTWFDPGASHRPSWVTPRAAAWLNAQLHFPAWRNTDIATLPTIRIGDWATHVGASFSKNYDRPDRDAGILALAANVPHLTATQLDVLPLPAWQTQKSNLTYTTWLHRAATAARPQN